MASFYDYFKENMDGLGLPAPESLYGNLFSAVGTAQVIMAQIEKYGKKVTVREVIGAASRLEQLTVISTLGACYYAGAIIGSIAVATGRSISGGTSLSDVLMAANQNGLSTPWLVDELGKNPKLYDRRFR